MFHRIRDLRALPSRTFLRLAQRLSAYDGAVAKRAAAGRQERRHPQQPQQPRPPARPAAPAPAQVATADQLRAALARVPGVDMWGTVATVKVPPSE